MVNALSTGRALFFYAMGYFMGFLGKIKAPQISLRCHKQRIYQLFQLFVTNKKSNERCFSKPSSSASLSITPLDYLDILTKKLFFVKGLMNIFT